MQCLEQREGLMNDNNGTDRLTGMSYCAEFDMGRRIQAISRDVVVNIKGW